MSRGSDGTAIAGYRIGEEVYLKHCRTRIFIFLSCFFIPYFAHAQNTRGEDALRGLPGEALTLKIAVMGPGDELYFWWGHIALMIDNAETGQSRFYDYGLFSFDNDHFFTNFAFGRLLYSCGVSPSRASIAAYVYTNRDVRLYTLDLPPEKREEVRRFAETNVLPENRNYYYHHFRDNCSTRIRDIIDIATGGQFKEKFGDAPGRFTFRQHVRRHTWFSPFIDWILNFWMGQDIDTPVTVWDEMFLPAEVGLRINDFWYTDSGGASRKLVSGIEEINRAEGRPVVLDAPRRQWPRELAAGIAAAALLLAFFFLQTQSPAGQILAGIGQSLAGLFFGAAGLLLVFMWAFTNHDYTYHNMNLLFANPLLLAAVPLGIRYAMAPNRAARELPELLLRILWLLVLLGIFASMLLKLLPWFWQRNLVDEMLMLPIALVLALEPRGLRELLGRVFWRWL
ncbi:MAG: DUF4105 domain-containing protein [Treponema sp.]|jgi:hypothetical protein|nr:DUF4105 domain-containing protein [Treponema sp.]